jgi:hypothetical protein
MSFEMPWRPRFDWCLSLRKYADIARRSGSESRARRCFNSNSIEAVMIGGRWPNARHGSTSGFLTLRGGAGAVLVERELEGEVPF